MNKDQFIQWCLSHEVRTSLPLIMAIINVTNDSFSDGGRFLKVDKAVEHALKLLAENADILDIGGESSRPGALEISLNEELDRVIPVIEKIRQESDACISIDTRKPVVMREAISAGATFINDISALNDLETLSIVANLQVPVCLMHMQGIPSSMQRDPNYPLGVISQIDAFFEFQINRCLRAGIKKEFIILDPGFGFGKTVQHNLQIIQDLNKFKRHGLPILLGVSRKSTIGHILNKPANERLFGSITLSTLAMLNGMNIVRTHDVEETKQALIMTQAVMNAYKKERLYDTA